MVTATVGRVHGTASITISKAGKPPPPPPVPPKATLVSWEGEIPAQKWMNFYTKVLTDDAVEEAVLGQQRNSSRNTNNPSPDVTQIVSDISL